MAIAVDRRVANIVQIHVEHLRRQQQKRRKHAELLADGTFATTAPAGQDVGAGVDGQAW